MEIILLALAVATFFVGYIKGCVAGLRRYHMDPDLAVVLLFDDTDANNILWYRGDDKTFLHQSKDYNSGIEYFKTVVYSNPKTIIYLVKS